MKTIFGCVYLVVGASPSL